MASKHVEQVLNGIKRLNTQERQELIKLLSNETVRGTRTILVEQTIVRASAIHTAPVGSGDCACCGR